MNYYSYVNTGMIRGMSSFLLGILAYRMYLHFRDDAKIKKYINYLEFISVIGIVVIVFTRSGRTSELDLIAPFWFMFVVVAFAREEGYLSRFLLKFRYLGEISYSIYLNQITILLLVRYLLQGIEFYTLPGFAIYLLILLIYSHFTYRYIEKPFRIRGRDMFARMKVVPASIK